MNKFCVTLAFASAMGFTGVAAADDLGEEGQFVISNDWTWSSTDSVGARFRHDLGDAGRTQFVLRPGVDYFLISNLSLGAEIGFGFESIPGTSRPCPTEEDMSKKCSSDSSTNIILGLAARVGYFISFGSLGIWPKAGIDYGKYGKSSSFYLKVYAPLTYSPTDHFYLGIGPNLDLLLSDGDSHAIGLQSSVGGYF